MKKHFETIKEKNRAVAILTHKSNLLDTVNQNKEVNEITKAIANEMRRDIEYLNENKEWNFNFVGGGWNYVYAPTKEEAIIEAKKEYNSDVSTVDVDTFRIATKGDTKMLMSLFY